jgi:phosphate/sulfate permease
VYLPAPTSCPGIKFNGKDWVLGLPCSNATTCFPSGTNNINIIPDIRVQASPTGTQGAVLYRHASSKCSSRNAGEMHFTGSYMGYRPEYRQADSQNALREGPSYWADLTLGEKGMSTTPFCMASRVKRIKGEALSAIPGNGFAPIAISWLASPIFAGTIAAFMFAITKYTILDDNAFTKLIYGKGDEDENSFFRALILSPFLYGFVSAVLVVLLAFKGVSSTSTSSDLATIANAPDSLALAAGVTGAVIFVLSIGWVSYWQYRVNWVGEDLKWYHWLIAPFAPKQPIREGFDTTHRTSTLTLRTEAASTSQGIVAVLDVNAVLAPNMDAEAAAERERLAHMDPAEIEAARKVPGYVIHRKTETELVWETITKPIFEGPVASRVKAALLLPLRMTFTFGIFAADGKERVVREFNADKEEVITMHKQAKKYSDRTELVFRQLQIITSCIAAFSHGANDVANAMGCVSAQDRRFPYHRPPNLTFAPPPLHTPSLSPSAPSLPSWACTAALSPPKQAIHACPLSR